MKHKRLNRDGWGFMYYPYYQMRIDHELFHGLACLIRMTDDSKFIVRPITATHIRDGVAMGFQFIMNRRLIV